MFSNFTCDFFFDLLVPQKYIVWFKYVCEFHYFPSANELQFYFIVVQ